jgi:polyisoprenoid-binding protein YceI
VAATGTPARSGATPIASPAAAETFEIVGAESTARYLAEEELADVGANTAIGTTNAIVGRIGLGPDGAPVAGGTIEVDLRTLTSDQARRDNFLRRNTLQTDTYPLATFVVTGVEDWPGPLGEGQEARFTLRGDLTVHGVTKPVEWEATATRRGETIAGTAATTIQMTDFGITPPKVGPVMSIDEVVRLELAIVARQVTGA